MDDLLREFLAETGEHLDTVDVELVRLERNPGDQAILRSIFRLVHTIKGTCGFLGLPRIEALAHAAESLMSQLRGGSPVTSEAVSLILASIDRIKLILAELERAGVEPVGADIDLIRDLEHASRTRGSAESEACRSSLEPEQVLLRPLRPGEVPLDELERVFRLAPGPVEPDSRPDSRGASRAGAGSPDVAQEDGTGDGQARIPSIRVGIDTLERLTAAVSELVLTRNQLLDLARRETHPVADLAAPLQRLSQVTTELQDGIMKTRMQPIGAAWSKLPRLVRDLSVELGRRIDLVLKGTDTELDRQVLDAIRDPLTHMVRNSAAHGIESPAERRALGKPDRGLIRLEAYGEDGGITIEVSDDGRGLDLDAIRRRAVELEIGAGSDVARLSDDQAVDLIFRPGFSTSRLADSVSGRGFGMDVVRTNIDRIGGSIEITSEPGRGTTIKIRLPLTLAIMPALVLEAAGQRFVLPQASILELVRVGPESGRAFEHVQGATVLPLPRGLLPVIDLAAILAPGCRAACEPAFVVVVQIGRVPVAIAVQALLDTEEVVVKPVSVRLKSVGLFSGTTLLGDGSVVLILDPKGLARRAGIEQRGNLRDEAPPGAAIPEAAEMVTLLIVRGGDQALKAIPLTLVARLEEIDSAGIERAGGGPAVQYRGRLMTLFPIDASTRLRAQGVQPVVVISTGEALVGLVVEEVVDIVDAALLIEPAPSRPDLLGTAIVRGRATEIVDLMSILPIRAEGPPARLSAASPLVLLVEDNPFFRELLIPVLKAAGYRVRTASGADEALALVLDGAVDAVVTDLDLPGRPGLDLVEAMRRHPATASIPVVASGSNSDQTAQRRALALGVSQFVSKFDRSGLLSALSRALRPPEALAA